MNGLRPRILALVILLALELFGGYECQENYRLKHNVVPTFYSLNISVWQYSVSEEPGENFKGVVNITLHAVQDGVKEITLHQDSSISIETLLLYNSEGDMIDRIDHSRFSPDPLTQQIQLPLAQPLTANVSYVLYFRYSGQVQTASLGLFSSRYLDEAEMLYKWIVLTHMEPIHARLVFPCFDEPIFKAQFKLYINRPTGLDTVSNTKLVKSVDEGSKRFTDHFEVTPLMSTYQLAFLISQYKARGNSELSILSPTAQYDYTEFSHGVAERVLTAFGDLFQQPYQQLGVTDGWTQKEFTIRTIIQQNSHMWFGGSVTCKWWSYVWLHEGFAHYHEYSLAQELYPEYQFDQLFVVNTLHRALVFDSVNSTQPMTSPNKTIFTPADIEWKHERTAFAKAACVIQMWRNIMGEECFNTAITNFLKQYHLKNAAHIDLFPHITENWPDLKPPSFNQFYYDYTIQVGYPRILVHLRNDRNFQLEQKRFLLNESDGSDTNLLYTPDWIIVNVRQAYYYRVHYDPQILHRIQAALVKQNHSGIPVENRAALIDDLFNFADADLVDYVDVFEFMDYMSMETDYIPWFAAYVGLEKVAKRLPTNQLPNFSKYLSAITAAVHEKLGVSWSDADKVFDVYNRNQQVAWLCKYQSSDCNEKVRTLFAAGWQKPTPDYRETFYCALARMEGYATVLGYYKKETNQINREIYWRAASCTRDYRTHYKNEILETGNSVALKMAGLAQLYEQNPDLVTHIFQMVAENIALLADALKSWNKTAVALSDMAEYFTTREQQQLFSKFCQENSSKFGSSADTLKEAQAKVDRNVQWGEQRLGKLTSFLAQRNGVAGLALGTTLLIMSLLFTTLFK